MRLSNALGFQFNEKVDAMENGLKTQRCLPDLPKLFATEEIQAHLI